MTVLIANLSGTLTHGSSITVTGSGFGSKAIPAPTIWDNCSHGQLITTRWDRRAPSNYYGDERDCDYYSADGSIALVHSNGLTKYVRAVSSDNLVYLCDYFTLNDPTYIYSSHYFRIRDGWSFGTGSPADYNFKTYDLSPGWDGPYEPNWVYFQYETYTFTSADDTTVYCDMNTERWDIFNGSGWGGTHTTPINSPAQQWIKFEFEAKLTADSSGFIHWFIDGVQVLDYHGRSTVTTGNYSFTNGGWNRDIGSNNYRYWADIYLDYVLQRVIVGNANTLADSTVREAQIPTAWEDGEIGFAVNTATFGSSANAYLYVVDSDGVVNADGYPIQFGQTYNGSPSVNPNGLKIKNITRPQHFRKIHPKF